MNLVRCVDDYRSNFIFGHKMISRPFAALTQGAKSQSKPKAQTIKKIYG